MRQRTIVAAAICCALGAGAFAAVAVAGKAVTNVTVDSLTQNADGSGHYEGTVKSERGKCEKRRKITLIHLPDFVIGETTTNEQGFWQLNGPIPPTDNDRIKVVVKPNRKCRGDDRTYKVGQVFDD